VVALDPIGGEWEVGSRAREIELEHPEAAVSSIKRLIGRHYDDAVVRESLEKSWMLHEVTESQKRRGALEVVIGDKHLTPQEISAKILRKLKVQAEAWLGHEINSAVISVPAYFHDSQRQATRDAGRIAGLEVRRVLNEPTAACLAYGYKKLASERRVVAVYDLGGGTFDISILEVGRGPFRVRATNGDTFLGGDDLNWLIVKWVLEQGHRADKERWYADRSALAHLFAAAEQGKRQLSSAQETRISLPESLTSALGLDALDLSLTRTQLESIAAPWIARTFEPCRQALKDARLQASDIDEVLLVGGQTRMQAVRKAVQDFFGIEPDTSLAPEEVVALGAAVQAAINAGEAHGLRLLDVVSLSLGVQQLGGLMDVLVPRNTPLPFQVQKSYSTTYDDQEVVEVHIYQGEKPMVRDNISLGSFMLKGIPPAPRGVPEIEVAFNVDDDGILHVSALDKQTGVSNQMTITDPVRLNEEEIAEMVRHAEEHEAEYAALQKEEEERLQIARLKEELHSMLEAAQTSIPQDTIAAVREALALTSPEDTTSHLEKLRQLWHAVKQR
jgi:molecular chaperone DnaK